MKTIPAFLCLLVVTCGASLHADEPKVESAKPQNGVFFTYTGYMTTVLELKDGHFRYWFETDEKGPNEPAYPVVGDYSVSGDTITLENKQASQTTWTFRSLDGAVTLWRPDAMTGYQFGKYLAMIKKYGGGAILVKSSSAPEDLWKHRGPPTL